MCADDEASKRRISMYCADLLLRAALSGPSRSLTFAHTKLNRVAAFSLIRRCGARYSVREETTLSASRTIQSADTASVRACADAPDDAVDVGSVSALPPAPSPVIAYFARPTITGRWAPHEPLPLRRLT